MTRSAEMLLKKMGGDKSFAENVAGGWAIPAGLEYVSGIVAEVQSVMGHLFSRIKMES